MLGFVGDAGKCWGYEMLRFAKVAGSKWRPANTPQSAPKSAPETGSAAEVVSDAGHWRDIGRQKMGVFQNMQE